MIPSDVVWDRGEVDDMLDPCWEHGSLGGVFGFSVLFECV